MAETRSVWGVDIGQNGLKAIRLRYAEAANQVIATGFDYIAHPKSLSQPDAIPEELIPQSLDKFLSRNDVRGDLIAISVPGQTALARFIQLPPVESSKVADIVKYEARQQIPFALEDVIWDYQTLGGGVEEGGFMLEAEVGLFAMKRDQVMQQLKPFTDEKVEVELIQIAPLAIYNFLTYDRFGLTPEDESAAMDEYTIVLDMGTDNTTLLVSNGEKIWVRNVPIGGNHFTRALTKDMKLTYAKAEHLKRNATKSPDPRAVFQALRPVFNEYVSEIQRSIGYFSSVNRDAKISSVLGMGNGFKLAGLQKFLQQNLQYEVEHVDSFQAVVGDSVIHDPLFEENILTFAVPYGLAIQGLGLGRVHTTLLPPEIATARTIRRKKPWAVAAVALLLFGVATSAAGFNTVLRAVSTEHFGDAEKKVGDVTKKVGKWKAGYNAQTAQNARIQSDGNQLAGDLESRESWLELFDAINACLPRDKGAESDIEDIAMRHRIKIGTITAERKTDLKAWFDGLNGHTKSEMQASDREKAPTDWGYLFTLDGIHYHNDRANHLTGYGRQYVVAHFLENLHKWTVPQEDGPPVPVRKIGLTHAAVTYAPAQQARTISLGNPTPSINRHRMPTRGGARQPTDGAFGQLDARMNNMNQKELTQIEVMETTFRVQFVWQPIPPSQRAAEPPEQPAADNKPNAKPNPGRPK